MLLIARMDAVLRKLSYRSGGTSAIRMTCDKGALVPKDSGSDTRDKPKLVSSWGSHIDVPHIQLSNASIWEYRKYREELEAL